MTPLRTEQTAEVEVEQAEGWFWTSAERMFSNGLCWSYRGRKSHVVSEETRNMNNSFRPGVDNHSSHL